MEQEWTREIEREDSGCTGGLAEKLKSTDDGKQLDEFGNFSLTHSTDDSWFL